MSVLGKPQNKVGTRSHKGVHLVFGRVGDLKLGSFRLIF